MSGEVDTGSAPGARRDGRAAAAWLVAGVLGGAVAGIYDTVGAIWRGIGGLSHDRALHLIGVGAGLVALAGALAGILAACAASLTARTRRRALAGAGLAALAAAPLVVYDAFALFVGHRAAALPGHAVISVALSLVGLLAVAGAARIYGRRLRRAEAGDIRGAIVTAVGLIAGAVACQLANRSVLPRLYGWFHVTLSVLTWLAFMLAARVLIRRPPMVVAAVLTLVAWAGGAAALAQVRASQSLRYAAYERTALVSLALRVAPMSRRGESSGAGERHDVAAALPPLPQGPRRPDADVLLITIDALRADHVSAYGYPRNTTPHIDALAAGGVRFARAYSQAPHTSFSVTSMLTGKYFATMSRLAPEERHDPIAAVLRNYGWKTAAFFPPAVFYIDAQKTKAYADTYFDFEYVKFEYLDAQRRVDQLLAYYDNVKPPKSLVWVHFFEPHEPYEAHAEFPFGTSDIDRYDSEIAYTDAAVGRLIKEVRARRPGTVIILGADHGEEFDEHGGRYHGSSLYEEQLRIPLIISVPGESPHVVGGQVQLIDVTPTVLSLLDIPVPARMRGTDLGPWLGTPPAPSDRLPPAFAELEDKRMVVSGSDKLICDLHFGFCSYFDLGADPHERHNLVDERPERAAALRGLLDDWLNGHTRLEPLPGADTQTRGGEAVNEALERGRLGELSAAPLLARMMNAPETPIASRPEMVQLLVALPPRPETAPALARAADDPNRTIADWASVGLVRLGEALRKPRVVAMVADPTTEPKLRLRAALALAMAGDGSGLPVLAAALERHDDIPFCRLIIVTLGKLRDRAAVPVLLAHLGEVQNRREMVEALGDIGDQAAVDPLVERLRTDPYVTVRAEAARSLAKIGDRHVVPILEQAERHDTEPVVVEAARAAAAALQASKP